METTSPIETLEELIAKHRLLREAAENADAKRAQTRRSAMKVPLNHTVSWPSGKRIATFDDPKIMDEYSRYSREGDPEAARAELDRYMEAAKEHAGKTGVLEAVESANEARNAEESALASIVNYRPATQAEAKVKADYLDKADDMNVTGAFLCTG